MCGGQPGAASALKLLAGAARGVGARSSSQRGGRLPADPAPQGCAGAAGSRRAGWVFGFRGCGPAELPTILRPVGAESAGVRATAGGGRTAAASPLSPSALSGVSARSFAGAGLEQSCPGSWSLWGTQLVTCSRWRCLTLARGPERFQRRVSEGDLRREGRGAGTRRGRGGRAGGRAPAPAASAAALPGERVSCGSFCCSPERGGTSFAFPFGLHSCSCIGRAF